MAKLTSQQRNNLPTSVFALPGARKYPVQDKNHAKAALSRVSANGTPEEKQKVRSAVASKYPNMGKK